MRDYPDTAFFHRHNANPKGRNTTDCTVRAFSLALNQDYEETLKEMVNSSLESGYFMDDKDGYGIYLASKGWKKQPQPKKKNGKKFTAKEFLRTFKGTAIAHVGCHHIVCIKDGKVWDTWDCTNGAVGNYWIKEGD